MQIESEEKYKGFSSTRASWQLGDKVTPCNKPHTRGLLERNPEWQLTLNKKRESRGMDGGAGFYGVFGKCEPGQKYCSPIC